MNSDLNAELAALQNMLERRVAELKDEVAHYPTPIARCDVQLPHLIEQRSAAMRRLRTVRELASLRAESGRSPESFDALLDAYGSPETAEEATLVARLRVAAKRT